MKGEMSLAGETRVGGEMTTKTIGMSTETQLVRDGTNLGMNRDEMIGLDLHETIIMLIMIISGWLEMATDEILVRTDTEKVKMGLPAGIARDLAIMPTTAAAMDANAEAGPSNGPDTLEGNAVVEEHVELQSERRSRISARSSRRSLVSSGYRSGASSEYGSARNLSYYDDYEDRILTSSQSMVSHRAMRVLDSDHEDNLVDKCEVSLDESSGWIHPIPFYWTDEKYEIGFHSMQGDMRVTLHTAYEVIMENETLVRIVKPGFDKDDELGLIQLFYGYDQETLRAMFAKFMFEESDILDCSTIASSEEEWRSENMRRFHISTALNPQNDNPMWDSDEDLGIVPDWVQHVLEYGSSNTDYHDDSELQSECSEMDLECVNSFEFDSVDQYYGLWV
ncbi:hypothetical protein C8J56DRAFT_1045590 [Mycena floridula]|nr:hypothetical protein C8J56DRAFT_1045590 [Mycena floridula]